MSNFHSIGIIGFGRFGKLLHKIFSENTNFKIRVFDKNFQIDDKTFFNLADTVGSNVVILAVPISLFKDAVKEISPLLKNETLVVDVCSVKVYPVKVMQDLLPRNVDILATHPMFGPDATNNGETFKDLKFIWAKVRVNDEDAVKNFLNIWKNLGCNLIELSPEEHDKQAAFTHAFAFLVGKIGIKLNVRSNNISTKGFEGILYNQLAVERDTTQLFNDLMNYNPYAKEMRLKFKESLETIEEELQSNL